VETRNKFMFLRQKKIGQNSNIWKDCNKSNYIHKQWED
jgi:hypothetical protein